VEGTEAAGDLLALPGALDSPPPPAPPVLLLAAFDTALLGYRTREPLVAAADDRHILPGGGMLRPAVLAGGLAAGTWGLARGTVAIEWFRRPGGTAGLSAGLRAEQADVERFLAQRPTGAALPAGAAHPR
ncbi:MAG TPA: crosslink repair DNA glycosylase YcaQ family protein, partial [Streptosporangiaceae bacterium]